MTEPEGNSETADYTDAIVTQVTEMVAACETGQSGSYKNLYDHCMVWAIMVPEAMVAAMRLLSETSKTSAGLRQIYADQLQYFGDWPHARLLHANNPAPLVRTWFEASQDAINLLAIPCSGEDFLASALLNYMALSKDLTAGCKPLVAWMDRIVAGDDFTYRGNGDLSCLNNRLDMGDIPFDYFLHHQQCSAAAIMGPKRIFLYRNPLDSYTAQYQRMMGQSLGSPEIENLEIENLEIEKGAPEDFDLAALPRAELDDINDFAIHFIFTMRSILMQREDTSEDQAHFLCFEDLIDEPFDQLADVVDYLELDFDADNLEQAVDFALEDVKKPSDGTPPLNLEIGAWKSGLKSLDGFRAMETMSKSGIDIDHFEYDPKPED